MLPKVINGYTVIASEWKALEGVYVILASRQTGPLVWEYVTAKVRSMDDSEWFWGNYFFSLAQPTDVLVLWEGGGEREVINYFSGSAEALADALVNMAQR